LDQLAIKEAGNLEPAFSVYFLHSQTAISPLRARWEDILQTGAANPPVEEITTEDLLRQADQMIVASQRERQRIEATMPSPSLEWQQEAAHFAETASSRPAPEAELAEVAASSSKRG
jgi:hypothetical protein